MQSEVFRSIQSPGLISGAEPKRATAGATCVLMPRAHFDLSPCANKHVHATTVLHSHAVSTLGSLSVRKKTCSIEKTAAFSRRGHIWVSFPAQTNCSCDNTAAFARCEHTWISLRAQRNMFRRRDCCVLTPGAHLDLFPCANKHVHATTLLHSHAVSTLGSLSVRKQTCSCNNSAAFARCEHAWISLRAQKDMFHRKDCCVLTPGAHLGLFPRANRHVHATTLLHSHAVSTLGSHSVRKEACSGETTAAFSRQTHLDPALCATRNVPSRKLL